MNITFLFFYREGEKEREEKFGGGSERHYSRGGIEKTIYSVYREKNIFGLSREQYIRFIKKTIYSVYRENNIFGLEGFQVVPASPSGRGEAYDQN
jgi:hypothetical protein